MMTFRDFITNKYNVTCNKALCKSTILIQGQLMAAYYWIEVCTIVKYKYNFGREATLSKHLKIKLKIFFL